MIDYKKIESWLADNEKVIEPSIRHNIWLLCNYAKEWDLRIKEMIESYPHASFKVKGTDQKVMSVNYETKEIEIN
jgi:hypothetical protein